MSLYRYLDYVEGGSELLGPMPAHWRKARLKQVSVINMGQSPSSEEYNLEGDGLPFLQGNADFGDLSPQPRCYCPTAQKMAQKGDILLSVRAPVGAINLADQPYGIGRGLCAITPLSELDTHFLLHSLQLLREELFSVATGSTYEAVTVEQVGAVSLYIPPVKEQAAIATFLDHETAKIDSLIAEQEKLLTLLAEKLQATISHAVTKGLNPDVPMKDSGVEWLGEVPAHWSIFPLKRVLNFLTSGSRGWAEHYSDTGALFLRIGNLSRDSIELDLADIQRVSVPEGSEGERTKVEPGDVLFSITAYLGSVAVVPAEIETSYVSQHVALARLDADKVQPRWCAYVTLSLIGKTYLETQGYGGTKVQLSLEDVANLVLTVPPVSEQRQLIEFIETEIARLNALSAEATHAIELLKERRTTLISAAVTGKIDVRQLAKMETAACAEL